MDLDKYAVQYGKGYESGYGNGLAVQIDMSELYQTSVATCEKRTRQAYCMQLVEGYQLS